MSEEGESRRGDPPRERAERGTRYRALASVVDGAVVEFDADGRVVAVDDEFVERTGVDRADVRGERARDVFDDGADGADGVSEALRRLREKKDADDAADRAGTAGAADAGTLTVWTEAPAAWGVRGQLSLRPVVADGQFHGAVGVLRDAGAADADAGERDDPQGSAGSVGSVDSGELEAREAQLAKYEAIFETLNDGIYVADEGGYYETVNEAFAELTGYGKSELLGEHATRVVDEATLDRAREIRESAAGGDATPSLETTVETADGSEIPVEVTFSSLEPGDGGEKRVGVVRDITERRERRRRIEESEQRYRALVRNFPNGAVGLFDDDLRYTAVGGELFEATDTDREDRLGYSVLELYPDDVVDEVEPHLRAALAGETRSFDVEFRGRHLSVRVLPVGGADGDADAGMLVVQDVTERTEHERELERRARQQQVVADLGQFALEADDVDELMDEAARQVADVLDNDYCKVLDLDDDERELVLRQGVGWDDGVVGNAAVDADADDSQAGYTLRSEEPVVVDDLATEDRFSGPELLTSHDVASGISTIVGPIEDPWGILGTHDTARKEFTDEDVNFVQSVANILADAIERDRYNAELERTIDDLEESNERLEQFAYAASHDLQEPLRMVSSYLSLIDDRYGDALDEDGREFLEYAVDGAERMREMIDALLQYSRVESRGDDFERVSLESVFADVRRDYEVRIEESDADVTVGSLPTVRGDENQLREVFGNLLSNAIEYSGDEPPSVHVSAERGGGEWVVAVRDDGIGIDPEHTDRIFDVFQRLHTREEHPGTGVGLALTQRIVERHGGDVWVESEPGEGSTFYFSIPDRDHGDD